MKNSRFTVHKAITRASPPFLLSSFPLALALAVLSANCARAQLVTQTFALRAGWNSIWLDVEPTNSAVGAVFAGAPLVSLWTFADRTTSVDFIEDPNEPVWNRDRWLLHVPTNRLESFQNNLFALPAKRAYLLNLTNAFTLYVTGRPVWRNHPWAPDAYTLRGFPVDPAAPPNFLDFFRPSNAHFDSSNGRLQKIYRLNSLGQWSLVSPSDLVTYGEAYWVFTKGGSDYVAPLDLRLDSGDGLDFGASVSSLAVELSNRSDTPATLGLRDVTSPSALSYLRFNPTNATEWAPLPAALSNPLSVGDSQRWRLAIRRSAFATAQYGSILEIKDGLGTRLQLALTATRLTAANGGTPSGSATQSLAGLWMGHAAIEAVNEVNSGVDSITPTPSASPFNLRLLVHVDQNGQARLLKEVVQLWRNGTTTNDSNGDPVLQTPGRFVLVTDERLFPELSGATLRDGTPAGRRISTIGFDFDSGPGGNFLPLTGSFGGTNSLAGTIDLDPTFPRNPFRHKFHPDHDNLDARFASYLEEERQEVYRIMREISLQFSNAPPAGVSDVDYGYRVQAGTYRETVTGLNKNPIRCRGTFRLTRVSDVGALNQ
jgi:hypothetical protein